MIKKELFWNKVSKMTKNQLIELIIKCAEYNGGELRNYERESIWSCGCGLYRTNWNGRNAALLTSLTKSELQYIAEGCTEFITVLSLV